jgi:ATP-dependent Clp protease, protease subunit
MKRDKGDLNGLGQKIFGKVFGNRLTLPTIKVESQGDEAHIYLYDAIGGWFGIKSQDFVQKLMAMDSPTIHLHINSPGGDVFEARAIQAAIRRHPSKIVSHIDGQALSAASFIAVNGPDEVRMNRGAFLMIHNSHTLCFGDRDDMSHMAGVLRQVDDSIAHDYASKTGIDPDDCRGMMDDETWLDCDDAMDKGFIDKIEEGETAENKFDLSIYAKVPDRLKSAAARSSTAILDQAERERRVQVIESRFQSSSTALSNHHGLFNGGTDVLH